MLTLSLGECVCSVKLVGCFDSLLSDKIVKCDEVKVMIDCPFFSAFLQLVIRFSSMLRPNLLTCQTISFGPLTPAYYKSISSVPPFDTPPQLGNHCKLEPFIHFQSPGLQCGAASPQVASLPVLQLPLAPQGPIASGSLPICLQEAP